MTRFLLCIAAIFCLSNQVDASGHLCKKAFSHEVRESCNPYLMPKKHHLKKKLDKIFRASRVTLDTDTFTQAGFKVLFVKKRSFIRVARHDLLPGYLVKVYLDAETRLKKDIPGWQWLVERCRGALKVRQAIKKGKIKHFQAPKKWLYALPLANFPHDATDLIKQPVILVVEDMQLVSKEENLDAWKTKITKKHLDELYQIMREAQGSSYRADNVWLSTNGKFSFIDTEYPDRLSDYDFIRSYLSRKMRKYWDTLTAKASE